jgi:predicted Zn-dependent protease
LGGRQDDELDETLTIDKLPSGATDIDLTSAYNYSTKPLPALFTDIMQLGGYEFEKELAKGTKISPKEENAVGDIVERELTKGPFKGKLNLHSKDVRYIRTLGSYLIQKVNRKKIKYKFFIVDKKDFNALAFPGGRIYIFQGVLDKLKNEAQLAALMAHEIKHIDLRHTITMYQIVSRMPVAGGFVNFMLSQIQHPFQGRVEADADRRGLELAYSSGYSPFQPVELWREIADRSRPTTKNKGGLLEFVIKKAVEEAVNVLDTHPTGSKRYILLQNHTVKLLKKYPRNAHYVGRWNFENRISMR